MKGVTLGMAGTGVMPFLFIASLTSSLRYSSSSFMQKQFSVQARLSTRSFKSTRAALVGSKYSWAAAVHWWAQSQQKPSTTGVWVPYDAAKVASGIAMDATQVRETGEVCVTELPISRPPIPRKYAKFVLGQVAAAE